MNKNVSLNLAFSTTKYMPLNHYSNFSTLDYSRRKGIGNAAEEPSGCVSYKHTFLVLAYIAKKFTLTLKQCSSSSPGDSTSLIRKIRLAQCDQETYSNSNNQW